MNPDYIFIFLVFLIILLFYLAIKYFKVLLFYLGFFLGIFLSIFWESIFEKSGFTFTFIDYLKNSLSNFFENSYIVNFFNNHIKLVFFLILAILFYKITYYTILIILHFIKWLSVSLLTWISNKREAKRNINNEEKNSEN